MSGRKALIVGYCPVAGTLGDSLGVAFIGTDSGRRLAKYAGLPTQGHLLDHFEMVNLFRQPDAPLDRRTARRRAEALWQEVVCGRHTRVVLASGPVANAFGLNYHPLFCWYGRCPEHELRECDDNHGGTVDVAVMPHPSGLVRWWNDPANVEQASAFLKGLMK